MENGDKHPSTIFLKTLFKNCTQGFFNLRHFASNRFIPLSQLDSIPSILETHRGENICFSPVTRQKNNNSKLGIVEIPGICVDLNKVIFEGGMEGFPLKPTIVVDSGDRYQCYWLLKEPAAKKDLKRVENIQKELAHHFNSKVSTDALPLPGTFNHRHNPSHKVVLKNPINLDQKYTFDDFDFLLKPEPQKGSLREEITQVEDIQTIPKTEESTPGLEVPTEKPLPLSPRHDPQPLNKNSDNSPTPKMPITESDNQTEGANPQTEDGHVDIADEIEEDPFDDGWVRLYRKIEHSEVFQNEGLLKVWIWCLIRANHQSQWAPIKRGKGITQIFVRRGQFIFGRKSASKALKIDESTIYKRIMKLQSNRCIDIKSNRYYSIITICNYEKYQSNEDKRVTGKKDLKVTGKEKSKVTGKEQVSNTNKNDKNDKNKEPYVDSSDELRLSTLLLEKIQENKRTRNLSPFKQPNLQKWAKEIDLMIRRDSRDPDRIRQVILWCQGDSFWWGNILSTKKLRDQFEQLEAKMEEKREKVFIKPQDDWRKNGIGPYTGT